MNVVTFLRVALLAMKNDRAIALIETGQVGGGGDLIDVDAALGEYVNRRGSWTFARKANAGMLQDYDDAGPPRP